MPNSKVRLMYRDFSQNSDLLFLVVSPCNRFSSTRVQAFCECASKTERVLLEQTIEQTLEEHSKKDSKIWTLVFWDSLQRKRNAPEIPHMHH